MTNLPILPNYLKEIDGFLLSQQKKFLFCLYDNML